MNEFNFGSRYQDKKGNMYKLVGMSKPLKKGEDILLFAPINAGSVGDVVYVNAKDADFEPASKYF